MTIKVVIDSAGDIPPVVAERYGITILPVYINIGDKGYLDGVDLGRQEFYENLSRYPDHPKTAAPSPAAYTELYEKLADEGATAIISVHIASGLSLVYNAARLGAEAVTRVPIHLFDSGQLTLGTGLLAWLAADAAAAGHTVPEIMALLHDTYPSVRTFATLNTLDSLRRSGRVSLAQFGLGTLLQIKPVIGIQNGKVEVVERVRTRGKSLARVEQMIRELAPFDKLVILHSNAAADAAALKQAVRDLIPPDCLDIEPMLIAPAIGAHVGAEAVGFSGIVGGGD
ncbi:MAG: DegV family protein [Chloroflexi bacterium]|nr:DegV family protein [Chloroflexota bacterium]